LALNGNIDRCEQKRRSVAQVVLPSQMDQLPPLDKYAEAWLERRPVARAPRSLPEEYQAGYGR
jgi:hypothetical protein